MDQEIFERRAKWSGGVFAAATFAVFLLVNLPWRYVTIDSDFLGASSEAAQLEWAPRTDSVQRAGWPWKYRIAGQVQIAEQTITTVRYQSVAAVLGNVLVAVLSCSAIWWLTIYRCRRLLASANPVRTRTRFDVGIALGCLLIPTVLAAQLYWVSRQHLNLAERVKQKGNAILTVQVPTFLSKRVPDTFAPFLARVTVVFLQQPSRETLDRVLQCQTLQDVTLYQTDLSTVDIHRLEDLPQLTGLAFQRCRVRQEDVQTVASVKGLTRLSFRDTKLSQQDLQELAKLPLLNIVDFRGANVSLAGLGTPRWANAVRRLYISTPTSLQQEATIALNGWKSLRQLVVVSSRREYGSRPRRTFTVELSDLPSLKRVLFTPGTLYRFFGQDLPSLQEIQSRLWSDEGRFPMWDSIVRLCHFEVLNLESAPNLKELAVAANQMTRLRLRDTERLQQVLCCVAERNGRVTKIPTLRRDGLTQQILRELRSQPSIQFLDLSGLPMADTDLSPLADLPFLKSLNLNFTGVRIEQLSWVSEAPSLQELIASDCRGQRSIVEDWLATLPKLKRLELDLSELENLEVKANSSIEIITADEFQNLESISLVDLPRMESALVLSGPLEQVRLKNLLRLSQLRFHSPLPIGTVLEGLPSLVVFSAGGPGCTDEIVERLAMASRLRELTLAYPNISTEQLKQLGRHSDLQVLRLRGCQIDEEVTRHWSSLGQLRTIDLGDNPINLPMLKWMQTIPTLRSIELADNELSDAVWSELAGMRQLSELSFSEMQIPLEVISAFAKKGVVQRLELVNVPMTDAHWQALVGASKLDRLVVRNCGLDQQQLVKLLRASQSLAIDTGGSPIIPNARSANLTDIEFRRLRPDIPSNLFDYVPRNYGRYELIVKETADGTTVPVKVGSRPRNMPMIPFRQSAQRKVEGKPSS